MKPRIYIDTSVIGGCEDIEFSEYSRRLMRCFERGDSVLVMSVLTIQELTRAPDAVRKHVTIIPQNHIEVLQLDSEAKELAETYIGAGIIISRMRADAQHIAIASVARVDALVRWNFKHIVNLSRIQGYNSVNMRQGYPILEIRTPREVVPDE